MKRNFSILAALALLLPAPVLAAEAAKPAGDATPFPAAMSAADQAKAVSVLHSYADCLATKRTKIVRDLLAMDFRSSAYHLRAKGIAEAGGPICMREGRLQGSRVLFVGALAEKVFAVDFGARDTTALWPTDWTTRPIMARDGTEQAMLCVVQKDSSAVRTFISTVPGSAEEKAAMKPLVGSLSACVPTGTAMRANRLFLRAGLALAAYRSARHFAGETV
jgi:hypothetical protein